MEEIGIESTLVESIKKGDKYIEVCLGKSRFLKIQEGDTLSVREDLWLNGGIIDSFPDSLRITITQILYFESFQEMLQTVDHRGVVPAAKSIDDAVKLCKSFYTDEDEREYGVVALYFDVSQ
ncbi:hypothetical protein H7200_00395 [Candidatus Saccharibacteria bacterium]|nr:hypothetical protein [Candidatus Saccharibacteria bacterium]